MSTRAEHLPLSPALSRSRVADLLLDNSLLVVLVALVGSVLLGLGGNVLVSDSWLTLMAGREIVGHGLPHHETLTVIPHGRTWTDQQWLAQLVFYGLERVGGLRLALFVNALLVTSAVAIVLAASRARGASARSTLIVAACCVWVAPWSWQMRAQALALPLFALVLWLAVTDVREARRRTFFALPLIALWANVHGSVLVGAGIVSLAGLTHLARGLRGRTSAAWRRASALAVLPWACVLVSPYHVHLVGYYRLMLVDSPVSRHITEWMAPKPHGWLTAFFVIAGLVVALVAWQRRRLLSYDVLVLAVTLAGSLKSGRGIVWFMLATMVLAPLALDGVLPTGRVRIRRRISAIVVGMAAAGLATALIAVGTRPGSWFEQSWPEPAAAAVARAAATVPGTAAVYPSDKHGDWLLWKEPSLRGRVAYDVRFEFFSEREMLSFVRFKSFKQGWDDVAAPYPIVVFDPGETGKQIRYLLAHGATTVYRGHGIVVLRRPGA